MVGWSWVFVQFTFEIFVISNILRFSPRLTLPAACLQFKWLHSDYLDNLSAEPYMISWLFKLSWLPFFDSGSCAHLQPPYIPPKQESMVKTKYVCRGNQINIVEQFMAKSNLTPNPEGGRRGALSPMAWSMLAIFTSSQTAWLVK